MTPRTAITAAEVEGGVLGAARVLADSGHSAIPIYEGTLDSVIDLGAGYCDLVNHLRVRERHAIDLWPGFVQHAAPGVTTHVGSVTDMKDLASASFDAAVSSNLLEHLEWAELDRCESEVRRILKPGGRWILLQPNYRYASSEYFDDYTHRIPISHVSLRDFLAAHGWDILKLIPRFVPLQHKSWMPLVPALMHIYLRSPIRPFAKQMFVVARKGTSA